ncbi:MAG: DNA repair protein RecO [Bacteroidales bacterium]|jgi:DNA repair protein RecO (recombination protein O)
MLFRTKGIVLHSVKYGESGIITRTYTEKFGKQSFLVHGVRKKKSKISPYLFQPLSILDIIAYIKTSRNLQKVKEIKSSTVLKSIHFDVRKSSVALFISELLNRVIREEEPDIQLFIYLDNAIQMLDFIEEGIENYHLIFLMQFTKFLGIYPKNNLNLSRYSLPGNLNLYDLLDYSLADAKKLRMDSTTRTQALDQLLLYYRDHIGEINEIKSLKVLHDVFAP